MLCWSALAFASGWLGNPVRLCDVAQQLLFAQQPREHGFASAVFVMMHGVVGNRTAAVNSVMMVTLAIVALRSISVLIPQSLLPVESQGCWWSLGWVSAIDIKGRKIWIVDAHGYGQRFSCVPEEILTAFVEPERAIHQFAVDLVS